MNREKLDYLVDRAYAVLGKAAPRQGIRDIVFENCRYFDEASADFLEKNIDELETMPGNLSKRFRYWHAQWQRNTGNQRETLTCKECHGDSGFWVWRRNKITGMYHRAFSPCPVCNADNMPGPQYAELRRQPGIFVMPPKYRGGALQFELDNNLTSAGERDFIAKAREKGLTA